MLHSRRAPIHRGGEPANVILIIGVVWDQTQGLSKSGVVTSRGQVVAVYRVHAIRTPDSVIGRL